MPPCPSQKTNGGRSKPSWIAGALLAIRLILPAHAATVHLTGSHLHLRAQTALRAINLTIASTASLDGNGQICAPTILSGTVSPGTNANDIGALAFLSTLTFNGGVFICHAATATNLDRLNVSGRVSGNATVRLTRAIGVAPWRQTIIAAGSASDYTAFIADITGVWLSTTNVDNLLVSWNRDQAIIFAAIADQTVRNTVGLYAIADSGLPVVFEVTSGPGAISSATNLTFYAVGTVIIRASQNGGEGWNPAPNVDRAINVSEYSMALAADVDGDGRADPLVYDMSTGSWRARLSGSGYGSVEVPDFMGGVGYEAVAADFDGDGLGDIAVYRSTDACWRARFSCEHYNRQYDLAGFLGGPGWSALAGDFDRDRKADPTVYAAANAQWAAKLSSETYAQLHTTATGFLGDSGWLALAGDLDGDGQADPAVYAPGTGSWQARFSSEGYTVLRTTPSGWLSGGPQAILADFDADGKADPAVWDTINRQWHARLSGSSYSKYSSPPDWL